MRWRLHVIAGKYSDAYYVGRDTFNGQRFTFMTRLQWIQQEPLDSVGLMTAMEQIRITHHDSMNILRYIVEKAS